MQRGIVFLDRDGTLNKPINYYNKTEKDIVLYDDVSQLSRLNRLGFPLVIITNQKWVHIEHDDKATRDNQYQLNITMRYTMQKLKDAGVTIEFSYACTNKNSKYQKPSPLLLQKAIQVLNIKYDDIFIPECCFLVGDSIQDALAAEQCGMTFIPLMRNDNEYLINHIKYYNDKVTNLQEAVNKIIDMYPTLFDESLNYGLRNFMFFDNINKSKEDEFDSYF
jgi:HAD superfamily hydrolase (TIGR01662 family)